MAIEGRNILVLGGAGLVGRAVCSELLQAGPSRLVVTARRRARAEHAVRQLRDDFPETPTRLVPIWGDVFLRADWQDQAAASRAAILSDVGKRRRLIADILEPLDAEIANASLLAQIIEGKLAGLDNEPAEMVIDCMNTATAVSYQNVYALAQDLAERSKHAVSGSTLSEDVEALLASLYVPQLVRHIQLLHMAMKNAGTQAYIKVGTTGTGGMGLNIPYTHGEEKPSRLLLSKAAIAGAQSQLIFLMARTPDAPRIVKEVKPAAIIGWREIRYGPIRRRGRDIALYDCTLDAAVAANNAANLVAEGKFGDPTGDTLNAVYIDTGENGVFSRGEFTAITALGQMQLVTPEDIARIVLRELEGGNTGKDIVAALDGAVIEPSYRGGFLRQAAINRLQQLEAEHGEAIAFEVLGPPRLSKLLFEASLLKRVAQTMPAILGQQPDALAGQLQQRVLCDRSIRTRMISIGIPILLSDGARLLRGPTIKSPDAYHGWVDLTPDNCALWQSRLGAVQRIMQREAATDTSSRHDRNFAASRKWQAANDSFDAGEVVAWIFNTQDDGKRGK
jgi:NAD(P)-dependent dehydrogenase (short-subunit alcohol dehydrogenase family)